MSNWLKHGRTDLCVGFQQQDHICEGGNCDHLKEDDQAYGFSSENDSFGAEYYLMCKSCFEEFLEERKKEPVECYDCKAEVPRNTTKTHIPYFVDEEPRKKWAKIICSECQTKGPHLRRLEQDEEDRSHDQDAQEDWFEEHEPDEPEVDLDPALTHCISSLAPSFDSYSTAHMQGTRKRLMDNLFNTGAKFFGTVYPNPLIDPSVLTKGFPPIIRRQLLVSPQPFTGRSVILSPEVGAMHFSAHANSPMLLITYREHGNTSGIKTITVKRKTN